MQTGGFRFPITLIVILAIAPFLVPVANADQVADIVQASDFTGGLIVQIGAGDGALACELACIENALVHGVDTSGDNVAAAREMARQKDLIGKVSFEPFNGINLPYIDNLVTLIVAEELGSVPMAEIMRVLSPRGVLCLKNKSGWEVVSRKPVPDDIDDWTHYLHSPSNNAVANDTAVSNPDHIQWLGSPPFSRHHDHMASTSAMVSENGRLFYINDEGSIYSIMLPSQWNLVARDAFNGTILWKKPIPNWHHHLWRLKSGPAQLPRRLVAVDDSVYVTLGLESAVSRLSAATGETLHTYEGTEQTDELIVDNGVLFVVRGEYGLELTENFYKNDSYFWKESTRQVSAIDVDTGKMLWNVTSPWVTPITLAVDKERVVFHDGTGIRCLDRTTGDEQWRIGEAPRATPLPAFYAPTLVLVNHIVLYAGGPNQVPHHGADDTMMAYSAETGELLWTAPHPPSGYQSPEDIFVINDQVWKSAVTVAADSGEFTAHNLYTGALEKSVVYPYPRGGHHRCYRAKATENYLLMSVQMTEMLDVRDDSWSGSRWMRGACLYGLMPANGMLYSPPHTCACQISNKVYGFVAAAPPIDPPTHDITRLRKGDAYDWAQELTLGTPASGSDWPTYRKNPLRSGVTKESVGADITPAWQTSLTGRLTSPVVCDGMLFVAETETHTLFALDSETGTVRWHYTTGGRIDSPPTVQDGLAVFGSHDGWIYCLRASDGALVWRFRGIPTDRVLVAWEQVESVAPIPGSVLIVDDVVWSVAGRANFLQGGLRILRIDLTSGTLLTETTFKSGRPDVGFSDILSYDGSSVYLAGQAFDLQGKTRSTAVDWRQVAEPYGEGTHLYSPTGFLDDTGWHRSYWIYGRLYMHGAQGYYMSGRFAPAGRPLVFTDDEVYGFGREWQYFRWTTPTERELFASALDPTLIRDPDDPSLKWHENFAKKQGREMDPSQSTIDARFERDWRKTLPIEVRSLVLADDVLFAAGPPDLLDEVAAFQNPRSAEARKAAREQEASLRGERGSRLLAVSTQGGEVLATHELDTGMPVFDGMIAANKCLFLTTLDGKVLAFQSANVP